MPNGTGVEERKRKKRALWNWMTEKYPSLRGAHGDTPWNAEGFWNRLAIEEYNWHSKAAAQSTAAPPPAQVPAPARDPVPLAPGQVPIATEPVDEGRLEALRKGARVTPQRFFAPEKFTPEELASLKDISTPEELAKLPWLQEYLKRTQAREVAVPTRTPPPPPWWQKGDKWWDIRPDKPAPITNPFAGPMQFAKGVGTGFWDAGREAVVEPVAGMIRAGVGPRYTTDEVEATLKAAVAAGEITPERAEELKQEYQDRSWIESIWPTALTPEGARQAARDKEARMGARRGDRPLPETIGRMIPAFLTGGAGEPAPTLEELRSPIWTIGAAVPPLTGMGSGVSPAARAAATRLGITARAVQRPYIFPAYSHRNILPSLQLQAQAQTARAGRAVQARLPGPIRGFQQFLDRKGLATDPLPPSILRRTQMSAAPAARAADAPVTPTPARADLPEGVIEIPATPEIRNIGNVAVAEGRQLRAIHVTSDPSRLEEIVRVGGDISQTRDPGLVGDLGTSGVYFSNAPQLWTGRAAAKWNFLGELDSSQRSRLAESLEQEIRRLRGTRYITESEEEYALRYISEFKENPTRTGGVEQIADQPFNVAFWKPEFLSRIGIEQARPPVEVPIVLRGRFADISDVRSTSRADVVAALKEQGFDGAIYRGHMMGDTPQGVVWNREAIEQFGDARPPTPARAADVDPAATSYGFAQQAAGQPVTPGTYPGVEAVVRNVVNTSPNTTSQLRARAADRVKKKLLEVIESGEKLTPYNEKDILRHTGMGKEDLGRLISEAREQGAPGRASRAAGVWNVRRDTVAAARAAKSQMSDGYIKFMENWWDDMWGIRGLQTGMGLAKRVLPKTRKDIEPGSELDIGAHITRFAGMVGSAMTRSQTAMELMQKMAPIAMEAGTFFDDVNKFLIAMHGKEVFAAKPNRKFVGKYQSPAEFDDLLKEVQLRLGDQGYNEIRRASAVVTRLYKHDLERYVKEGMIGREIAEEMNRKYQWYNPIRYIEGREGRDELFDPRFTDPKDPTKAFNPLWGLGEVGKPKTLTDPLEYLTADLVRNESQIALNRIKRAMITLAREGQIPGVKQAKGKITLVATEGEDKIFRAKMDPKGKVSFFTPDSPGKIQVYDVPEYLHREINYLASTRHPGMMPLAVLGAYNGFMRGATVTYNPGFIVSNMLNDTFTVLGTRGIAPWTVFGELRETLKGVERSRFMQAFARAGGVQQRFYGESMEQFAKEAGIDLSRPGHREGLRNYFDQIVTGPSEKWAAGVEANISRTGGNVMGVEAAMKQLEQAAAFATKRTKAGVDIIPKLGKATEQAPRVAAAKKRLDQLMPGWRARFKSGELTIEELAESPEMAAAVESGVEATINFGRGGHVVKEINQYVLFLNAAMEGAKLPWRAVQRRPAAFGLTIAGAMGGQLALTQYNMQYEEYFDIPLHERLSSVVIMLPSTWRPASMGPNTDEWGNPVPFRINLVPKTREWSLGLGTMTWMTEAMGRDNPVEFKTFMSTLIPEVTPFSTSIPFIPLPELAETITEAVSNFDLYRNREIVSERLQHRERSEQYVAWTSPTIKWLAGTLPLGPLESPLMLEHVFRSVFGGAGAEALSGVDLLTSPWREDAPQEVREGAEKYKATTTAVERRRLEVELGPEPYKKVVEEARKPGGTLYNLPVAGGLTRRIMPATKGEAMRTGVAEAARATGIDPDETYLASQKFGDITDDDLKAKRLSEEEWVRLDDMSPAGISGRLRFTEDMKTLSSTKSTLYNNVAKDYPKSVYAATPGNKTKYFEIMATGGGVGDRRTRGQVLLAGYYAIQPADSEDQTPYEEAMRITDLSVMFEERDNYVKSLSPEDQDLLNEELNAGRTDAEKLYHADLEYIRSTGFWDVNKALVSRMGLEDVWEDYKGRRGKHRTQLRNDTPSLDRMLKAASDERDRMRAESYRGRSDKGELEQKLIYWGIYSKSIAEKVPQWQRILVEGGTPMYGLSNITFSR